MSTLTEQLQGMEAHNALFETAVRQLPLPVCPAFGSSAHPQAVCFAPTGRVLTTKDSASVAQSFPNSVQASGNVVLASAGANTAAAQGKRVAVLFSGGPASGGHNVVYETRAVHEGVWTDNPAVFAAMFDAALNGFPTPPTGPRRIVLEIPR